jgi:putative membrane protein
VPWLVTLILLVLILVFEVPQMAFFNRWNATWLLFLISAFCLLLSFPLSRLACVQRLFVPQGDQAFQVEARALLEFYLAGVASTRGRTGILLFISLMERKAVVLADEAISKKLPRETWAEICKGMIEGIQHGQTSDGLIGAIRRSGELLAQNFPNGPEENINELSNQLILKE